MLTWCCNYLFYFFILWQKRTSIRKCIYAATKITNNIAKIHVWIYSSLRRFDCRFSHSSHVKEHNVLMVARLWRLGKSRGRNYVRLFCHGIKNNSIENVSFLRGKLWLGDLLSWHLATLSMKTCGGLLKTVYNIFFPLFDEENITFFIEMLLSFIF